VSSIILMSSYSSRPVKKTVEKSQVIREMLPIKSSNNPPDEKIELLRLRISYHSASAVVGIAFCCWGRSICFQIETRNGENYGSG